MSLAKMDILYIGNDAKWFALLRTAFTGNATVYATTPEEAQASIVGREYVLIVVDTVSLVEANVAGAITRLRTQQPESHIVLASALPSWDAVREALKAGASDYIVKPNTPDDIARLLSPYLKREAWIEEKDQDSSSR